MEYGGGWIFLNCGIGGKLRNEALEKTGAFLFFKSSLSHHIGEVVVQAVGEGGFFTLHDVAVDLVDHILGVMSDVVGDIHLRDVQKEHNRDGIVSEAMEAVVFYAAFVEEVYVSMVDGVRGKVCDKLIVRLFVSDTRECLFDDRDHGNRSGACGGLGLFQDKLVVFVIDQRALYGDGVLLKVNIRPAQCADLAPSHAATGGEVKRSLHGRAHRFVKKRLYFLVSRNLDLGLFLLRKGGFQRHIGAIDAEYC